MIKDAFKTSMPYCNNCFFLIKKLIEKIDKIIGDDKNV